MKINGKRATTSSEKEKVTLNTLSNTSLPKSKKTEEKIAATLCSEIDNLIQLIDNIQGQLNNNGSKLFLRSVLKRRLEMFGIVKCSSVEPGEKYTDSIFQKIVEMEFEKQAKLK